MPNLCVVIPASLASILEAAVANRGTSLDSVVITALSQHFQSSRHRAYQISTSAALVQGVYQGAVSAQVLLANGDFGLGTFEHLDGEMVVLEGNIYQIHGDGSVERRQGDFGVPFAVVSRFHADGSFAIPAVSSLQELKAACDSQRESNNLFYALRIDGIFDRVHVRAAKATSEGKGLLAATQMQAEFHLTDIEGSLVCIWSPQYSSSFSVPGYHFHFLAKDRTRGGHVLDCSAKVLHGEIQVLSEYDVRLPENESFLKTDLAVDTTTDLQRAE